jgi:hypothetical protein
LGISLKYLSLTLDQVPPQWAHKKEREMKKNMCIKVHVTPTEYDECVARAKRAGLSLSAFMLSAGLSKDNQINANQFLRDLAVREAMLAEIEKIASEVAQEATSQRYAFLLLEMFTKIECALKSINQPRRTQ